MSTGSEKGIVKFFKAEPAGYGFIYPMEAMSVKDEDARDNIFFHFSGINPAGSDNKRPHLDSGDEVSFDIGEVPDRKNPGQMTKIATNITLVKKGKERRETTMPATSYSLSIHKKHLPLVETQINDILKAQEDNRKNPEVGMPVSDDEHEAMKALSKSVAQAMQRFTEDNNRRASQFRPELGAPGDAADSHSEPAKASSKKR